MNVSMYSQNNYMNYQHDQVDRILMNDKAKIPKQFPLQTDISAARMALEQFFINANAPEPPSSLLWKRNRVIKSYTFAKPQNHPSAHKNDFVLERTRYVREVQNRKNLVKESRSLGNSYSQQNRALSQYYGYVTAQFDYPDNKKADDNQKARKKAAVSMGNYWLKTNYQDPYMGYLYSQQPTVKQEDVVRERRLKSKFFGNFWSKSNILGSATCLYDRPDKVTLPRISASEPAQVKPINRPSTPPKIQTPVKPPIANRVGDAPKVVAAVSSVHIKKKNQMGDYRSTLSMQNRANSIQAANSKTYLNKPSGTSLTNSSSSALTLRQSRSRSSSKLSQSSDSHQMFNSLDSAQRMKFAKLLGNYWLKQNYHDSSYTYISIASEKAPETPQDRKTKSLLYGNFWSQSNRASVSYMQIGRPRRSICSFPSIKIEPSLSSYNEPKYQADNFSLCDLADCDLDNAIAAVGMKMRLNQPGHDEPDRDTEKEEVLLEKIDFKNEPETSANSVIIDNNELEISLPMNETLTVDNVSISKDTIREITQQIITHSLSFISRKANDRISRGSSSKISSCTQLADIIEDEPAVEDSLSEDFIDYMGKNGKQTIDYSVSGSDVSGSGAISNHSLVTKVSADSQELKSSSSSDDVLPHTLIIAPRKKEARLLQTVFDQFDQSRDVADSDC